MSEDYFRPYHPRNFCEHETTVPDPAGGWRCRCGRTWRREEQRWPARDGKQLYRFAALPRSPI